MASTLPDPADIAGRLTDLEAQITALRRCLAAIGDAAGLDLPGIDDQRNLAPVR